MKDPFNMYIPYGNKTETATKRLMDFLRECNKLGLKEVNLQELYQHLFLIADLEENLLKLAFMDGRDFQAEENNKTIYFQDSSDKYFLENYIRYIK